MGGDTKLKGPDLAQEGLAADGSGANSGHRPHRRQACHRAPNFGGAQGGRGRCALITEDHSGTGCSMVSGSAVRGTMPLSTSKAVKPSERLPSNPIPIYLATEREGRALIVTGPTQAPLWCGLRPRARSRW